MTPKGRRRVWRAAVLGAVLGSIGMAGRYTRESLPNHPNPVQTYAELGTEAITPPAIFALIA